MKQFLQYLRLDRYRLAAASIVALAIILRIVLMAQSWPLLDSDEGTMGIMGLDIAYRGATPVFFCGQNYMGALEAYHAAPMFYLFGPTGFALHCGLLSIYTSSLGVIYLLTSALYRCAVSLPVKSSANTIPAEKTPLRAYALCLSPGAANSWRFASRHICTFPVRA